MNEKIKGIFVTGTGTGVGKTYAACALAKALRGKGKSIGVMKPISTGDRNDARKLIFASQTSEEISTVNPVFLKAPLAPFVSAGMARKNIDLSSVSNEFNKLKKKYDFLIVEGIGGLMVPIKRNYFVIDLIKKLSLPVVVVANPKLGAINHVLLTIDKLKQKNIPVLGVIFSYKGKPSLAEKTNPEIIARLTGLPVTKLLKNKGLNLKNIPWITRENLN